MNVDSVFNAKQLVKFVREMKREIEVLIRLNVDIETQVHPYLQTGKYQLKFCAWCLLRNFVFTVLITEYKIHRSSTKSHRMFV